MIKRIALAAIAAPPDWNKVYSGGCKTCRLSCAGGTEPPEIRQS